jgi:hypothetical protein
MFRLLVPSLVLLSLFAAPARAYDILPQVYGVAEFLTTVPKTDLITFGNSVTPGGGPAFDFRQFGPGGARCTEYTGQPDWLCASASASVDIDRQLVATTTYIGIATSVRLKAQVHLDYRNATAYSAQIWAKASLMIPVVCNGGVLPGGSSLHVLYRIDGEYSVSGSDPAVKLKAPPPFQDCTPGGVCTINVPTLNCSDDVTLTFINIELGPIIQIDNSVAGHTGWSVQGVSDYSHTFTLVGMDAIDDQGHPRPDVRLVVPGDGGAINDYFLTGAEAAEVAANSTTTTTTIIATTTTSPFATTSTTLENSTTTTAIIATTTTSPFVTTSTTLPSCATADLAAAACRCASRPAAGCEGVTLPKPADKGVNGLCAKIAKATAASGRKQRRLAKQAVAIAKKTLRTVNGKKGNAIADACREGLRGFLQAEQTEVGTATH